ncbi:MAG: hypothetical protein IJ644_04590 [Oscillospiraceae bacterium]|nr:hypothetical protein [Oscillospiraceae bacterium]
MNDMLCLGYYIAGLVRKPDYCLLDAESILTVSIDALGNNQPDLTKCFYSNYPKRVRKEYADYLHLNPAEFSEFCNLTANLIETNALTIDRRFSRLEDARNMFRYFQDKPEFYLTGLFTKAEYIQELHIPASASAPEGVLLGHDILGAWNENGCFDFECYLINSLEKELLRQFDLKVSPETGLIQNSFSETERFAQAIQGMGEPVRWMPFAVYTYQKN